MPIVPVILSGGAGTRLWPVSREGHPKPFMRLPDGKTLLCKTYERAAALLPAGGTIVTVTNREHYFASKDQLAETRLDRHHQAHFLDRKSTRLNSSHVRISYAVFCLKKKKKTKNKIANAKTTREIEHQ